MEAYLNSSSVIPPYDFTLALSLPVDERMDKCVEIVQKRLTSEGLLGIFGVPPVPESGASEFEIQQLASEIGTSIPDEYQTFLSRWRYLVIDDGLRIWGLRSGKVGIGSPWVSDQHHPDKKYLVFGDYWSYADGDQLMFDLSEQTMPVIAYLHEHGPRFENYAPTFSLALWRMVHEWSAELE